MQTGEKCSYYQADRSNYWQTGEKCNGGEMQQGRNAPGEKNRHGRTATTTKADRSNYWQTGRSATEKPDFGKYMII